MEATRCYNPHLATRPCPTVIVRSLTIRGGVETDGGGGGIQNGGTLTLWDATVRGNRTANLGGGIYNANNEAVLVLRGSTSVHHNIATINGGGIFSDGTVVMNGSSTVRQNTASSTNPDPVYGGGGIFNQGGELVMNDASSVRHNTALMAGGGVVSYGPITMNDDSIIEGNRAAKGGGLHGARVTMNDRASITGNEATVSGGGIAMHDGAPRYLAGVICGVNIVLNSAPVGPQMYPYIPIADPQGICGET